MAIQSKICVTNELAQAVGGLAQDHPDCSVSIAWDDDRAEQEWLVKLDSGTGDCTYVINDETGEVRLAGLGEGAEL